MDEEKTDLTLVCHTTLSVPNCKLDTVAVGSSTIRGGGGPDNCETMLSEDEDIRNLDEGSIEDDERNNWVIGAILHFGLHLVHFRRRRTVRSRRWHSVKDCFRKRC